MRGNQEAEILEKTFKDRLTVERRKLVKDPETNLSREISEIVYEKIACAVSQGGNSKPDRSEFHSESKFDAVLFTPPGVFLLENDKAEIITAAGQRFCGTTGRTFGYISHGETPFTMEKKV